MARKASAVSGGTISPELSCHSGGSAPSVPPRSAQSSMPPPSTGRASTPAAVEDARGDHRARAGRADRDHGLLLGAEVVGEGADEAVRHVPRAVDVALVAFRLLAHVEHLDLAVGQQALEVVDLDRVERLARVGVGR